MPISKDVFTTYIKQGWSVIPVRFFREDGKVQKRPAVRWAEFQTRLPTEADVDSWFALRRPDGIGLITGQVSGVVVVDVDTAENLLSLSSSIVSKSAFSGGKHYFYKWDDEVRNTVRMDGMPIDFRGDGGYVVLPPSEFEGHSYSFENYNPAELTSLPNIVRGMLTERKKKESMDSVVNLNQEDPFPVVTQGSRNDTAARVAGYLFSKIDPKLWNSVAWETLSSWNQRKCDPPMPECELRTTFNSIMGSEARAIVSETTDQVVGITKPLGLVQVSALRLEERELERTAPSTGYKDLDKFIRGFIPGHVYTMTGETNVGKTTVCCNFAHRVSQQHKKVLYFALEPENTLVDYLASVRTGRRFDQLSDVDLTTDDPNINIYSKESISTINDMVSAVEALPRYDLVIIDHIGYFTSNSRDVTQKQSNVMKQLAALSKSKRCAIMIVAHMRKRSSSNLNREIHEDDISGSAAFKQDATEVLIIARDLDKTPEGTTTCKDSGKIYVRKTKTGGGQGEVNINFKPGSAVITDMSDTYKEIML